MGKRNREYLEHYGVPTEKTFSVPHFVDNEWFEERAQEVRGQRSEIGRQWGAGISDVVALFVGKLIPEKRPAELLRAMAELRTFAAGMRPWTQTQPRHSGVAGAAPDARHPVARSSAGVMAVFVGFVHKAPRAGGIALDERAGSRERVLEEGDDHARRVDAGDLFGISAHQLCYLGVGRAPARRVVEDLPV